MLKFQSQSPSNTSTSTALITLEILYGNETMSDTVATLSGASLILAAHGAAMANLVFAPKHAILLEMAPSPGYWNPCFLYLSRALEIR
jgi:capsular polysaccharide biosynthesis protein